MNRQRKPDTRKQPETTPFKSKAQKAYKTQAGKNDIYSTVGGHKNLKTGAPYNLKTKRAGTDRLRFEVLEVDPEGFPINDELEPRIWKGEELRPFISKKLMEIANDFIDGLPFPSQSKTCVSQVRWANYNWSKYSDIDLHIVVDFTELDENKDLVKEMFDAKRLRWNENHNITIKGYEVELYVEDEGEEHSSSGVYSCNERRVD